MVCWQTLPRCWQASLVLWASTAQAHLLNMTEAKILVTEANVAELTLQLDPSRYFPDRSAYYQASLRPEPLTDAELKNIVQQALAAIQLQLEDESGATEVRNDASLWRDWQLAFADASHADYLDPLKWPKVTLTARQQLPPASRALSVVFLPDFVFEEPISLTLQQAQQEFGKTRWLIAMQSSPRLNFSGSTTSAGATEEQSLAWQFYFTQGFKHILPWGVDHLLFVFALAFCRMRLKSLVSLLSVFTVAHCLTLVVSTYGVVRMPGAIVEPLIALSIAWAGFELIRHRPTGWLRFVWVFLFGLVHGLGFAGALSELGLPVDQTILALLLFNSGIEVGQLSVVLIGALLTWLFVRCKWNLDDIKTGLGLGITSLGLAWVLLRVLA
ncbi:HupE/UreJ family protein [Halioxenophilus sp. WMMB6]|uniref:HupE/UreJ family protein n=1 Tax=Halioxenophilus sp. WMMB6 TaxID=3073815 RepID=UPI00295E87AA|nr:HupE/UreJ family protein [Halioxenophilus sp. WMMB6]